MLESSVSEVDCSHSNRRIRLQLLQCDDGWGWRAWEELVNGHWQPLRQPAFADRCRRFKTQEHAERFFGLLAEWLAARSAGLLPERRP